MNIIKEFERILQLKSEDLEYLKKSNLPLVLLGVAELGATVKCLLYENSIKIDYVAVNKEYWQANMKFHEFDVLAIENILANNFKMNVIVAFAGEKYQEKITELNKLPNVQKCLFFDAYPLFDFVNQSTDILADLYNRLADDLSRQIILEFMRAKNLMNARELIKLNVTNESQYFPDFFPLSDNETFVDCGAYTGDTIEIFLQKANKFNKIFAFEPDLKNAAKCRENLCEIIHMGGGVNIIEKGVWSEKAILSFSNDGTSSSSISGEGNVKIEVDSIDNVCSGEKVTFIKMDVEGAELEALKGAEKQIKANKPKLAICVYHKKDDLITIPQYILSLNPDYKLYLRHYGSFCTELVLYAI